MPIKNVVLCFCPHQKGWEYRPETQVFEVENGAKEGRIRKQVETGIGICGERLAIELVVDLLEFQDS